MTEEEREFLHQERLKHMSVERDAKEQALMEAWGYTIELDELYGEAVDAADRDYTDLPFSDEAIEKVRKFAVLFRDRLDATITACDALLEGPKE